MNSTYQWIPTIDPADLKREKAKGRELKASQWWKQQVGPGICHHCGQKFKPSELTMDHVIPLARGGRSSRGNVVPSCLACNQSRAQFADRST